MASVNSLTDIRGTDQWNIPHGPPQMDESTCVQWNIIPISELTDAINNATEKFCPNRVKAHAPYAIMRFSYTMPLIQLYFIHYIRVPWLFGSPAVLLLVF
jgi:hypothetical protein